MSVIAKDQKEASRISKEEWREYTKTVWHIANVTDADHPAVFPLEIPHRLVKLFSFVDETVLDPFGGTGTTAIAAAKNDRRAITIDQNPEFVRVSQQRVEEAGVPMEMVDVKTGDSRDIPLEDESVELIVTSPPYWDKADYGGGGDDLGSRASYAGFLESIKPVFEECYRVLAPGRKMCVVTANVNQHTDFGLLTFPLATDFTAQMRDVGLVMVSEVIWSKDGTGGRWGSANGQRPIFGSYPYPPNFLFKNVHEHILIFAKPPRRKKSGPTVRTYQDLME